jgi:hypothetical protein
MIRFDLGTRISLAALVLATGAGTLTAGVWDVLKGGGKKAPANTVVRAQEPNPAPPSPLNLGEDPAYARPALPTMPEQAQPSAPTPIAPGMDYAPYYSGFSGSGYGHACIGCREPDSACERCQRSVAKSCRRMCGHSYYCDCYPLFGPRYGFYTTCWRRLPEDCRCPIFLPPRKSTDATEPSSNGNGETPAGERVPPPPQALRFR